MRVNSWHWRQVLGVANKMLTVLMNVLIWDDHATPMGIACLVGCLACATAYRPAPLRRDLGLFQLISSSLAAAGW